MPVALAFILGIFSMGFQLLGSRLLNPWFGSSIVVWAFIISSFLAAFSLGSLGGGLVARLARGERRWWVGLTAAVSVGAFAFNAALAHSFLDALDRWSAPLPVALGLACGLLFFPPVAALAVLTPLLIQRVTDDGASAGFASGLIYCVGTLGNIAGIMLTVFVMIPWVPVSSLLWIWAAGVGLSVWGVFRCLRV